MKDSIGFWIFSNVLGYLSLFIVLVSDDPGLFIFILGSGSVVLGLLGLFFWEDFEFRRHRRLFGGAAVGTTFSCIGLMNWINDMQILNGRLEEDVTGQWWVIAYIVLVVCLTILTVILRKKKWYL